MVTRHEYDALDRIRHELAANGDVEAARKALRRYAADVLEGTANAWTRGEWANHMITHTTEPAQIRIGSANAFGDWLRERVTAFRDGRWTP